MGISGQQLPPPVLAVLAEHENRPIDTKDGSGMVERYATLYRPTIVNVLPNGSATIDKIGRTLKHTAENKVENVYHLPFECGRTILDLHIKGTTGELIKPDANPEMIKLHHEKYSDCITARNQEAGFSQAVGMYHIVILRMVNEVAEAKAAVSHTKCVLHHRQEAEPPLPMLFSLLRLSTDHPTCFNGAAELQVPALCTTVFIFKAKKPGYLKECEIMLDTNVNSESLLRDSTRTMKPGWGRLRSC
eukprot:scaffold51834_cov67-Attheya_sp.AAC.1